MASIGQSFVHAVDPTDADAGDAAYAMNRARCSLDARRGKVSSGGSS